MHSHNDGGLKRRPEVLTEALEGGTERRWAALVSCRLDSLEEEDEEQQKMMFVMGRLRKVLYAQHSAHMDGGTRAVVCTPASCPLRHTPHSFALERPPPAYRVYLVCV